MEQILKNIKNPFDIQGFVQLLTLLVNSSTERQFYERIVTYHRDRSMEGNAGYVKIEDDYIMSRNDGLWQYCEYFSNFFPTEHRVYINSSLESTKLVVEKFINECISENIPFELKYITKANNRSDGIVIGSNSSAYKMHIDILRRIAEENPEIINQCGTPHLLTAPLDGWMGLADENISNRNKSYTQSRIGLILSACTKYLINHPEFESQVEGYENMRQQYNGWYKHAVTMVEDKENTFSERNKSIERLFNEILADSSYECYFRVKYADLCKVINQNPNQAIKEIYQIFLENCAILGINPNMPTQYDTSKNDLLQVKKNETTVKRNDLENKSYIDLINEYFSNPDVELTTQESLMLLRAIDERMVSEVQLMGSSLMDAILLTNDTKDIRYLQNSLGSIMKHCGIDDEEFGGKLADLCQRYMLFGKNSKEEKKNDSEILNCRIGLNSGMLEKIREKNFSYFSKPMESIENMKKSLITLQAMLEKHNRISPNLRNRNLETKIEFLEFMVEHYDEIQEYFLQISTKLESMSKDEVEDLTKKFYVEERPTAVTFRNSLERGERRIAEGVASGIEVKRDEKSQEENFFADLE